MLSRERHSPGVNRPSLSWNAFALASVVLAGALCLAMPFSSDQALLTLYARQLTQGAVLYRDLFDIKQPGIFIFYAVSGQLFGFTEVGIHLFELLYWLVFSIFALVALRPYFTAAWAASLVPVFTVVAYYFHAGTFDLTQIEILVAFPILVAWWLIDRADPGTRAGLRRYAAAGLATAVVVLLKYLYILIILAFLGYAMRRALQRRVPIREIRRCVGAFVVALVVPLLFVVAYFAAHGQLERIWWVYFEFVPNSQLTGTKSLDDLKFGARRFMIGHAPLLILAVAGCIHAFRHRIRPQWDLLAGMLLWGAFGSVAVVVQGWWDYKWLLFTVPLGILATVGAQVLVAMPASLAKRTQLRGVLAGVALAIWSFVVGAPVPQIQTRLLLSIVIGGCAGIGAVLLTGARAHHWCVQVLAAALGVSVGLTAIWPIHKFRVLMGHDFALTNEARASFRRFWNGTYDRVDTDQALLRARLLPGPLHVFGDPVILLRANRAPAIPFLGQDPHSYDDRAWREMDRDLRSTLPPNIIVDGGHASFIRSRFPAIMEFIESRYKVVFVGASGTCYVLRQKQEPVNAGGS
jgi:Dolichyl-phosphate-mannose-protein mannosyltransferase